MSRFANILIGAALVLLFSGVALAQTAPPVLVPIGGQAANEGVNLSFAVSATDDDATIPSLTTSTLPTGASFTDNGDGTGGFSWTPGFDQAGDHPITFYANDAVTADIDSELVVITVTDVPQAPVVADIPDQTIAEGATFATINLSNYVSDVDNTDAQIVWTYSGNTELTVSITDSIATITTPSADWNGSETITFTATDPGSLADSDAATFTVTADNDAPVVSGIPDQTIAEGASFATINLSNYVSDVDNTDAQIVWTYSGNTELTVSITDSLATITTPSADWNGSETITFTATDPGSLADSDAATFTVTAVNDAPVVTNIPDQAIAEGATFATINLSDYVTDVDNSDAEIVWTYSGNTELTVSITDSIATVTTPAADWNGSETITFTATDPGSLADSDAATFTVTAVNDAPVVTDIPDQTIAEGATFATINLSNYVSDVDNTDAEITWTYSGNTELTVSITDSLATITTPSADWNGSETITFTATDPGSLADSDAATFTVTAVNDAPVVTDIPDQTIAEGATFATINLSNYVSDVDNTDAQIVWTYSGNTELTVSITDSIATVTTPAADWNGSETITFTATDPGSLADSDAATFTVTAVNDAPVVTDIPDQTITEGATFATINLSNYVSDVDNTDAEITWTYSGNTELTVSITDSIATVTTPTADWNGSETITFTATDPGSLADSDAATFTVTADNDAPVVTDIPDQTIAEGASFATINLSNYVSDVDNTDAQIVWTYSGNTELTVSITDSLATVTTPAADWNGSETITFTATDPGSLADSDAATFTVTAVNDAPVVTDIPDQTIAEGASFATINLSDYVSDVDNTDAQIVWTYSGNTELTVSITDSLATITTPSADWNGSETITFTATDPGSLADSDAATFTVTAVNDAPVLADIPDQMIAEGATFATINLSNYVSDVDNTDAQIVWTYSGNTELTVSITDSLATITTPTADWNGSETITFTATDPGSLADSDAATFTVTADNDAPVVTDIPDQTIAEGATFATINLSDYVSDVDNTDAQIVWTYSGNTELTVSITDSIATVTTPAADWNGSETITFTATDPGSLADSDAATFTVTAVNDAPVVTDIPDQTIAEGASFATINLSDYVSDVDNTDAQITWTYSGNTELTVSITDSLATVTTPAADWNGAETITFTATDPGSLADSDAATFTVTAVNDAPVVTDIPDQTIAEGATFATINLSDYVSDVDNTDAQIVWTYSGNTELTVSITDSLATITTPTADWNGSETITFTATDPGSLADSDAATFTVTADNDAPVVTDIPDQTIAEGATFATINLSDYVSDVDNTDAQIVWTYSGNTELSVDITARVATITIPTADWNGSETITFTATDPGSLADSDAATFTVTAINDAPVVSDIPDQTIAEGASFATINLSNYVSDVDNTDAQIVWTYSGNTELTVSITDSLATITTPSADWNGSETITFTATDPGSLADSDAATFTVTAVNDAPVVTDIPDQTIAEGASFATINLSDYVSDVDNTDAQITWTYSGNTELTVSITDSLATISTPTADWNGSETITFTATDAGSLADSDAATFTVTADNDAPVVSDIPDQTIAEGASFATINLNDYVSDVDNTDAEITWTYSGNTELTVSITDSLATVTTPAADWNGSETITFTATDPGSLADSDAATFTVTADNDAPVVTDIPDQTIAEGETFATINLSNYVSDVDNTDAQIVWTYSGNTELTVSITDSLATISTPSADWNGSETITFTATDPGLLTDSDAATFTVTGVNDAPVLAAIGPQSTTENTLLSFAVSASDIEDGIAALTTSALPSGATFIDNGDGTGDFAWTPTFVQQGVYTVTFTATDNDAATDEEIVTITVNDAGNQAPVLAAIGARSITENSLLSFSVAASDAEGALPVLTTSALPTGASFVDNGDGTGQFSWTPTFIQQGVYPVTFTATDDSSAVDVEVVSITVNDAGNQPPVLASIGSRSTTEGVNLAFSVSASDPEGAPPALTTSTLPSNATFVDNGDGTGNFSFTPGFQQAGVYSVTFTATDDSSAVDFELVTITVGESGNQPPVLATIGNRSVTEGATLNFGVSATDPDGTTPSLSTSALPPNASFVDNGNGTGNFSFSPDFTQAGTHNITFYASDLSTSDSEVVVITVNDAGNQTPVLAFIGPRDVIEGQNLNFTVSATDADGVIPVLTTSTLPLNAAFLDNGDGTGTFDFNPNFVQSGIRRVTFYASDGQALDSEVVFITIIDAGNQDPTLNPIGAQAVVEGANLTFGVSGTDPENRPLSFATSTLPVRASFVDNGNGTGTFSFDPDYTQAGAYDIMFYIEDDSAAVDSELVTITVNEAGNQPPVLAAIGAQSVDENATLAFSVSAVDADSTFPALTTSLLPANATFLDNGDGTGDFSFSPDFFQAGLVNVTFYASDGVATDSEQVVITVNNINRDPVLDPIGNRTVNEGGTLSVAITASDLDLTTLSLTTSALPANATFVDNGDNTGSFVFTPSFYQAGDYIVTFFVDDGEATDEETITITVNPVNQRPVLNPIGAQFVLEGDNLNLPITAYDLDSTALTITSSALPPNATFVDNGDGTALFDFNPDYTQSDIISVRFIVTDGVASDSELVFITIEEVGNQPPVLNAIGSRSVQEGQTLSFAVTATDPERLPLTLTTSALPANASFVDNGNGTGSFSFSPDFTQSGAYSVTFTVTDDSAATDFEVVGITVTESGNQGPVVSDIPDQTIAEGATFATIALDNFVSDPDDVDSTIVWTYSGNTELTVGITNRVATITIPNPDWFGSEIITFTATDPGLANAADAATFTVTPVNDAPVVADIPDQTVDEGAAFATINLDNFVSDIDGTPAEIAWTYSGNTELTVSIDVNRVATVTIPDIDWYGSETITFTATDSGLLADSDPAVFTVTAVNDAPVLAPIGPRSTGEDVPLSFAVSASDLEDPTPALTASGLPTGATFVDNGDGTGAFNWTPDFTQSGVYAVTFTAIDDSLATDEEIVTITVNDAGNQTPVLATIGARSVTENNLLSFAVSAVDADSTIPALNAAPLPRGASFVDNGDGTGAFSWTPDFSQQGIYQVTFVASDGIVADSEVVEITVIDGGNQTPVLAAIGPRSVTENNLLSFAVSAVDADSTIPALTAAPLPRGASFADNGDGTGAFDWTPDFSQQGSYFVTFVASDGIVADSEVVEITVIDGGNQTPVLASIGAQIVTEDNLLSFAISAVDADSTVPALSAAPLPSGASFVDNGDGTGAFDWSPDFSQQGVYEVTFVASDGIVADSELVEITVVDGGNQTPVLAAIGPQSVTEDNLLSFAVGAVDADSTIPILSAAPLPRGAAFVDNGDGSGSFDWTPDFSQQGSYFVTFVASDGVVADSEVVEITVIDGGNQTPVLASIGPRNVTENSLLSFAIGAVDADSTIPALTAAPLPRGASFMDNGDGTGAFEWTPDFAQQGVYLLTFVASDGLDADSEVVEITVIDAGNQTPVLTTIGDRAVNENTNLTFVVSAVDADSTIPALTAAPLPSGAAFVDNGDGTGTFDWTPGFDQAGLYSVWFVASDGLAADSELVDITVGGTNRMPIADAGPDQFDMPAGQPVQLDGSASFDPDADSIGYNWLQVAGPGVVLDDATVADPSFTPTVLGVHVFELTVDDGLLSSVPDTVEITVVNAAPPRAINDLSIAIVSDALELDWSAITLDESGLPTNVDRYVIYRGTAAYFTPTPFDSIGYTDPATLTFTDANIGGANVVGDTTNQYFYTVEVVDVLGNRSAASNRVGEYDYPLLVTTTTDYNLVGVPFTNTGITTADQLISAIGTGNVLTVNNYVATSQSWQSRFAAGFGTNFTVRAGGIYQVNAARNATFSVAGRVPAPGTISYPIVTTATTDYNFLMIPFERQAEFSVAQDVINNIPGVLNTLNNFVAGSQSYQSRFAVGFGTNFPVRPGRPYQANAATIGTFPAP